MTELKHSEMRVLDELFRLPSGEYPALIFIKDYGTGKPFLVDMSERRLERLSASP